MELFTEIARMLTGIVIFLLGASFLEEGIKAMAGRSFKLFLKKHTSNRLKAIGGGTIVTAVLQSSSVVNLMILAFVGAGVIQMESALAVMMGANLGTTLDSWVVATLGFKFDIQHISYPLAAVAGLTMLLSNKEGRLHNWSKMLFGFAFLFVGLSFIKGGMEDLVKIIDLSGLENQPSIVFLLIGLLITAIIQSSSATVVIVLSALHSGAIGLFAGMAVILGAEVGSSLKLILASAKGSAIKKRVAWGNVLLNMTTVTIVFFLLLPIHYLITEIIGIKDILIALVFFQTMVNIIGIIIFYPLIGILGRFLEKRFTVSDDETLFIHKVRVTDTDPALVALEQEVYHMLQATAHFTVEAFDQQLPAELGKDLKKDFKEKTFTEQYEYIKQLNGEIYDYSSRLLQHSSDKDMLTRSQQLIDATRNTMYAAKNIKDAWMDIDQLKKSSNDRKYEYFTHTAKRIREFFQEILGLVQDGDEQRHFETLVTIYKIVQENYKQLLKDLHQEDLRKHLSEVEFSTILNFNREISTCEKSILFAVKDLLLTEEEAVKFDELPGFIR